MNTRSRLIRTVAVMSGLATVLSGCSIYDLPLPGGADTGDNPMTVNVKFADVLDLVPQSTVKVDDVTVGKVSAVKLDGYLADVTLELQGDVELPDNALAEIRQTSLLGEKFVSLKAPEEGGTGKLSDGDRIPLDRSSRNPEVEEVLGAMSLLLNGGGVGQLKLINEELNNALSGREADVKSLLRELGDFMGQLDENKEDIVKALENLNRLSIQLRRNDDAIKSALDNLPAALKSIDSQREALVKMLKALDELSSVGVKVIRASKEGTINALKNLAPVLTKLADSGRDFPRSFQVFLTYPFVDEAVGRDPQVARNLHMGDFTNLAVRLDLNVTALPSPGIPAEVCEQVDAVRQASKAITKQVNDALGEYDNLTPRQIRDLRERTIKAVRERVLDRVNCDNVNDIIQQIPGIVANVLRGEIQRLLNQVTGAIRTELIKDLCAIGVVTGDACKTGGGGGGGGPIDVPDLPGPLGGLGRSAPAVDAAATPGTIDVLNGPAGTSAKLGYNSTLAALLLQGVAQ